MKDYEKNFGNITLNCSRINSMPSGFSSSAASINGHNSSFMSRRSGKSTANSSIMPSRISSAKSTSKSRSSHVSTLDPNELLKRATSATRLRPEWNDRW